MFSEQLDSDTKFWTKSLTSTVGLGILWRFPYLLYSNKGAPFLIPFMTIILLMGIPQYFLELSLGQYFQESVFYIYQKPGKKYNGVVYSIFLLCLLIGCYYIYLVAFALLYIFHLVSGDLPWAQNGNLQEMMTNSNNFFNEKILNFSESKPEMFKLNLPLLGAFAISSLITYFSVRRDLIKNSKFVFVKVALPFVALLLLLVQVLPLPGFLTGFWHLSIPHIADLMHPASWVAAAEQVLFQLSLGAGTLTNLGAIRRKKSSVLKPCFILPMLNAFGSFLIGVVIYGFLGYVSQAYALKIDDMPLKGEGMVFTVYPMIFSMMDFGKVLYGIFLLIFIISGIDSQVNIVETSIYFFQVIDPTIFGKKLTPKQARNLVCGLYFVLAIPISMKCGFNIFQVINNFSFLIPLCFINLINNIIFARYQNFQILLKNISRMAREAIPRGFITISLSLVIPIALGSIIFFNLTNTKPPKGLTILGWILVGVVVSPIFYYYLYYIGVAAKNDIYTNLLEEDFLEEFDLANESRHTLIFRKRDPMIFSSDKKLKGMIELEELSEED